jgi:hypothetical protein
MADRGHITVQRVAIRLAGEIGIPFEHALALVGSVFAIVREDIATAKRFVIPGVLVVERRPEGSKRPHSVRFVLHSTERAHQRIIKRRERERGAARGD